MEEGRVERVVKNTKDWMIKAREVVDRIRASTPHSIDFDDVEAAVNRVSGKNIALIGSECSELAVLRLLLRMGRLWLAESNTCLKQMRTMGGGHGMRSAEYRERHIRLERRQAVEKVRWLMAAYHQPPADDVKAASAITHLLFSSQPPPLTPATPSSPTSPSTSPSPSAFSPTSFFQRLKALPADFFHALHLLSLPFSVRLSDRLDEVAQSIASASVLLSSSSPLTLDDLADVVYNLRRIGVDEDEEPLKDLRERFDVGSQWREDVRRVLPVGIGVDPTVKREKPRRKERGERPRRRKDSRGVGDAEVKVVEEGERTVEGEEGEDGAVESPALKAEEEEEEEEEMSEEEEEVDSIPIVQPHPPAHLSELLALEHRYHLHTLTPPPALPPLSTISPNPSPFPPYPSLPPLFNARLDLLILPELSYLTSTIATCQRWQSSAHLALQTPIPVESIKALLAEGRGLGVVMEEVAELERASWRRMWEWEVREVVKGDMDWMVGVGLLRELKKRYPSCEVMGSVRDEWEEEERKGLMVEEGEEDEKPQDKDSDEEAEEAEEGEDQQDQQGKAAHSLADISAAASTSALPSSTESAPPLESLPLDSIPTAPSLPQQGPEESLEENESSQMTDVPPTAPPSDVPLAVSSTAAVEVQAEGTAMDLDTSLAASQDAAVKLASDEAKATSSCPSPCPSTSSTPTPVDDGFLSTMASDIRQVELRVLAMWWWTARMQALFSRRLGPVLTRLILGGDVRPLRELIEGDDGDDSGKADLTRPDRKAGTATKRRRPTAASVSASTAFSPSASPIPASGEEEVDLATLYCYCQRPYMPDDVMISCDSCSSWYHITCLWLTKDDMRRIDKQQFVCPTCCEREGKEYKWRDKPPSRKKRIYGVREELVKRRVEELREVRGAEASRVRLLVERAEDWKRGARGLLDDVLQTKKEAEEESVLDAAERVAEEEADCRRRDLADRRRRAMEKKAERAERRKRTEPSSEAALIRVIIEPAMDGSGVVVRVEAPAMERKEGVDGDAAATDDKGVKMEDVEDSGRRNGNGDAKSDAKAAGEKDQEQVNHNDSSKGKERGDRVSEKPKLKRKASDSHSADVPARAARDVLDEVTVARLKAEREQRERVLAQRSAYTDRLQRLLREGLSIPLEMDERREVEDRVRLLLTLERTERLLIANSLNTKALDTSTAALATVTRKNELKTLTELVDSLARMRAAEHREHSHEQNRVMPRFELWHRRLMEWNATVVAMLQASALLTSQPTSLSALLDLQGTQRLLFAALSLPSIVDLNLRIAACLRWLPKEKKHFARQSKHSTLARLLMERFGECGNVQSSWTGKIVREVERAEAWTKRVDDAIERKAGRGAFEKLLEETEGPGRVWADATDISVCQQYVDLYCLCQLPYQDGVFMIGCDSCDDWYHPQCVAMTPSMAKKIKRYQCPRCCKRKGVPYAYGEVKGLPDEPEKAKERDKEKGERSDRERVDDDVQRKRKKLKKEERQRARAAANGKEEEVSSGEERERERKRKRKLKKEREKQQLSPVEKRADGAMDTAEPRQPSGESPEVEKKKRRRRRKEKEKEREKERDKDKERNKEKDRERREGTEAFPSVFDASPSVPLSSPSSPIKAKKRRRRSSTSSEADPPTSERKRKQRRSESEARKRKAAAATASSAPSPSPSRDAASSSASSSQSSPHSSAPSTPPLAEVYAMLLYEHLHRQVSTEHSNILWHLFHSYMARPLDARLMEEINEAVKLVCGEEALEAVSDTVLRAYVQKTGHTALLPPPRRQRSRGRGSGEGGRAKDGGGGGDRERSKQERRKKPKGYPRAAKSAYKFFVSFVSAHRRVELDKLVAEAGGGGEKSVSRIIAEQWKKLSAEEKEMFEVDARREKDRFHHQLKRWEQQQEEERRAREAEQATPHTGHPRHDSADGGRDGHGGAEGSGTQSSSRSSTPKQPTRSLVPSLSVHPESEAAGTFYYSSQTSSSPSSSPYPAYPSSMIPMAAAIYSPHQLVLQQQQLLMSNPSHAYHAHAAHLHSMQLHGGMQAMQLPLNMGMLPIGMVQAGAGGQMLYVIQSPCHDQQQTPLSATASTPQAVKAERRPHPQPQPQTQPQPQLEEAEHTAEHAEDEGNEGGAGDQGGAAVASTSGITSPTPSSIASHTNLRLHPQFTLQSHQPQSQPPRALASSPAPLPSVAVVHSSSGGGSGSNRTPSAALVLVPLNTTMMGELRPLTPMEVEEATGASAEQQQQQQQGQQGHQTAAEASEQAQLHTEESSAMPSGAVIEEGSGAPAQTTDTAPSQLPQQ